MDDDDDDDDDDRRQRKCHRSILRWLDSQEGVVYRTARHEATSTSEDSAKARGVPLSSGGKALLLRIRFGGGDGNGDGNGNGDDGSERFSLFVVSASRRLDAKAVKKELKRRTGRACKDVRFATGEELSRITGGLVPGCVPPFGKPILRIHPRVDDEDEDDEDEDDDDDRSYLELYVDTSIAECDDDDDDDETIIAFNAGSLTDSVIMSVRDYLRIAKPSGIFAFSKPSSSSS